MGFCSEIPIRMREKKPPLYNMDGWKINPLKVEDAFSWNRWFFAHHPAQSWTVFFAISPRCIQQDQEHLHIFRLWQFLSNRRNAELLVLATRNWPSWVVKKNNSKNISQKLTIFTGIGEKIEHVLKSPPSFTCLQKIRGHYVTPTQTSCSVIRGHPSKFQWICIFWCP